jgi:hypothetical protein
LHAIFHNHQSRFEFEPVESAPRSADYAKGNRFHWVLLIQPLSGCKRLYRT